MELNLKNYELTFEEEIYYANYSLIELCDLCHYYFGFENISLIGNQFICDKCKKEFNGVRNQTGFLEPA